MKRGHVQKHNQDNFDKAVEAASYIIAVVFVAYVIKSGQKYMVKRANFY